MFHHLKEKHQKNSDLAQNVYKKGRKSGISASVLKLTAKGKQVPKAMLEALKPY